MSDEQILDAIKLAGKYGVFAEPAASAALAGTVEAIQTGVIARDQSVLVMITGSGLKDIRSAIRAGGEPIRIHPGLGDVVAAIENE